MSNGNDIWQAVGDHGWPEGPQFTVELCPNRPSIDTSSIYEFEAALIDGEAPKASARARTEQQIDALVKLVDEALDPKPAVELAEQITDALASAPVGLLIDAGIVGWSDDTLVWTAA